MAEYDAVVYDLDGTLVRLAVDWDAARRDVIASVRNAGVELNDESLWELLDRSYEEGFEATVEEVLVEHERKGAHNSTLLATASELPRPEPVGVCSLNAESACRVALAQHNLETHVEAVVGRDTVDTYKPNPEPLLLTIDALGARPEQALFVGDTERDAETAKRAGVPFRLVTPEH